MFESNKTILQLLKQKDKYDKLRSVVNTRLIDYDVRRTLNTLDTYWRNYPNHDVIMPDVFLTELNLLHEDLDENERKMYKGMVDIMMKDPDPDAAKGIMRTLLTLEFADKLERAHGNYNEGADMDLFEATSNLCQKYERDIARSINLDFVRDTIEEIIQDEATGHRFIWPLRCLNGSMPNLRTGQQVIIAARPGRGKTSLCAFIAVHMAPTTPDNRPVMWLNNEGKGRVIKGTTYRAALAKDFNAIITSGAAESQAEYEKVVGGPDRIRIFDIHGKDYRYIERLIDKHRPALVFFDMLDNIHGFDNAARTDLRLEELYKWARESAVIYDFLSIPTSQISVAGEGVAWCDQSMLKDSKVGKQGACDAILMMGAKNGPEWAYSRFMYIPKTKQAPLPGHRADCTQEVQFDGDRCQFIEVMENESKDVPV